MSNRKMYRRIARKYGVSAAEVKREMENAIEQAWKKTDKTPENIAMQRKISPDGSIPSVETVIRALSEEVTNHN